MNGECYKYEPKGGEAGGYFVLLRYNVYAASNIPAKPLLKCDIASVYLIIFIAWRFVTN